LYPYHIARLDEFRRFLTKNPVHFLICFPIFRIELDESIEIVAQRPYGTVAITFIKIGQLFLGEEDRMEFVPRQLIPDFLLQQIVAGIYAWPSDPMFVRIAVQRRKARSQATFTA